MVKYIKIPYDCYGAQEKNMSASSYKKIDNSNLDQSKKTCISIGNECFGFSRSKEQGKNETYYKPVISSPTGNNCEGPGSKDSHWGNFYLKVPDDVKNITDKQKDIIDELIRYKGDNPGLTIEHETNEFLLEYKLNNKKKTIADLTSQISSLQQSGSASSTEINQLKAQLSSEKSKFDKDEMIIKNVKKTLNDVDTYNKTSEETIKLFKEIKENDDKNLEHYLVLYAYFKYYYNNNINTVKHTNNELDDENNKLELEIKYRLNDIFIKDNKIEILKLLVTGVLLSLVVIMLNNVSSDRIPLPVINIVTIIMTIFIFIVIIRILRNLNKRDFNFREYKYSQHPGDRSFLGKLGHLLYNAIPKSKHKKKYKKHDNSIIIPHGNVH